MEWIGCLKLSIEYIEKHLLENINADELSSKI